MATEKKRSSSKPRRPIGLLRGAVGQKEAKHLAAALDAVKMTGLIERFPSTYAHSPAQSVPPRIICSRSHANASLAQWLDTLACPYTFIAAGSSLKFCRLAEGLVDVYPRFAPISRWDTGAAQCTLGATGGTVLDLDGEPLRYGRSLPILNPHFIAIGRPSVRVRFAGQKPL